jgi:hypothetical protein
MKRTILVLCTLLAMAASVASAAPGVNLRWNSCLVDGGAINKNFACNTNSGVNTLVGSIQVAADILQASGHEVVVDLASEGASLPAWWQFKNAGTCRPISLSMNFAISAAAVDCVDWASGQAAGGIGAYNIGVKGPNTARVVAAIAVPASALADLFVGTEYFVFNLAINNLKTVGTGACADCQTPVCLVYVSDRVTTQVPANDRILLGATNGTDSFYATWQGGGVPVTWLGTGCPRATPTRNTTWGAVKSVYR